MEELDLLFGELTDAKKTFEELKIVSDPNNNAIADNSIKDKVEADLISTKNSDNALPNELSKQDDVPISTEITDGIHHDDETDNTELISTHNSDRAIAEKPVCNTEEINVISTINSSRFETEV